MCLFFVEGVGFERGFYDGGLGGVISLNVDGLGDWMFGLFGMRELIDWLGNMRWLIL